MSNLTERFSAYRGRLEQVNPIQIEGKITRVVGLSIEATGCHASIGSSCIITNNVGVEYSAEVVGFEEDKIYLMPLHTIEGIAPGARVSLSDKVNAVSVGDELLGRVIDGEGNPLDGRPRPVLHTDYPLMAKPVNPLHRHPIDTALDVGVRVINAMVPIGRGQRMGLFAGSGVGKSVLLSMMTKFTEADVIVVALIGERGREVKEFIEKNLGPSGLARSTIIAAPADTNPLMRLHGALRATAIAEYFRDQGKNVLLLMDSLTRFAQAQREIALAIGEPPATKGYPPSAFTILPNLVERAGTNTDGSGSITAFYTVLTEGDDLQDPIADAARAILDGHIVLSRKVAESGVYPAVDIEASISRVMTAVCNEQVIQAIQAIKYCHAKYNENSDLIQVGAYQVGTDPELDTIMKHYPAIREFITQELHTAATLAQSQQAAIELANRLTASKQ